MVDAVQIGVVSPSRAQVAGSVQRRKDQASDRAPFAPQQERRAREMLGEGGVVGKIVRLPNG